MFENPFATDDYIFETSPSSKNDDMFINEHTLEDNYSIVYDDTMPPVFDNYHEEYYDIGYNYNHPDRKSTRLNSSHRSLSRMPSSA